MLLMLPCLLQWSILLYLLLLLYTWWKLICKRAILWDIPYIFSILYEKSLSITCGMSFIMLHVNTKWSLSFPLFSFFIASDNIFSRFVKEISVKTGIQPLILSEFSLSLSLSLSLSHTHTHTHARARTLVSVGCWFEWLTCQEFEEPSSMLERCNDELKKVYVGYKQHALYLSIFLYSCPQAGRW